MQKVKVSEKSQRINTRTRSVFLDMAKISFEAVLSTSGKNYDKNPRYVISIPKENISEIDKIAKSQTIVEIYLTKKKITSFASRISSSGEDRQKQTRYRIIIPSDKGLDVKDYLGKSIKVILQAL